jgi:hypothetical protein
MSIINPAQMVNKDRLLDTYAAEAVAAGTFDGAAIQVPRGAQNIRFRLEGTLFDRTTGNETYDFKVQGRMRSSQEWADIPSCAFTQVAATTAHEIVPSATNAPGVIVPRWVRVRLTSAGTTPIATAKIWMLYDLPRGAGRQVSHGAVS